MTLISFERESNWQTRERTTEIMCDVMLDGGCGLRLASDEPEGDREWRIIEFQIADMLYDVREAAFSRRESRGLEPVLPEGELLREVRAAFRAWVAEEAA